MIDSKDLTSYIQGYEDYCKSLEKEEKSDDLNDYYEDYLIQKEIEKMNREIINLKNTNLTFNDIEKLSDYVWKNNELIPAELLDGE